MSFLVTRRADFLTILDLLHTGSDKVVWAWQMERVDGDAGPSLVARYPGYEASRLIYVAVTLCGSAENQIRNMCLLNPEDNSLFLICVAGIVSSSPTPVGSLFPLVCYVQIPSTIVGELLTRSLLCCF